MKRLIYNFDGTSNEYDADYPTNVVMMDKAIAKTSPDGIKQVSVYLDGVGTQLGQKVLGGATGYGLLENIMEAYTHLCKHYVTGDEIYVFGFSRGAYTARSFAGLIGWCGIVDANKFDQIDNAKNYYRKRLLKENHHLKEFNQWRADNCLSGCANEDDLKYRNINVGQENLPPVINIRYIGVWDTVRTLGVTDRFYRWHDDNLSSSVDFARHAIALDERRKKFDITSWGNIHKLNQDANNQGREGKPYQQLWFPGTHGSVGGGGRVKGLSDEAFQWIRKGAKEAGLSFIDNTDAEIFSLQPNSLTWLFNSVGEADTWVKKSKSFLFKAMYWTMGMIDRKGPESIDDLHQSTIIRYFAPPKYTAEQKAYRPKSLSKIHDALVLKGSPYKDNDYISLHQGLESKVVPEGHQENISIDGVEYLVHSVIKGDTLSAIAKKLTSKSSNYHKIQQINAASIPNPDVIYVGQRIFIPVEMVVPSSV